MRLVSLTLQGFKSFGNRATLEFDPGVTAIVGPNGSGKSNVLDALKWTSGGGRASAFRAEDKTDLIFHGAAGKRSMGLAEVEIELQHGPRSIRLYRSLDRDGNTRLKLNGRNARFLDLEEALAGSGLGRSGLAVIGQEEVSQVLMADPERLLAYVAEAAGAARLATRRDQTRDRLDTAKGHLDRLQDVLAQLEERAEALAKEAEAASRHALLSREALELRYTAAVARREALLAEIDALTVAQAKAETALAEGRGNLAGCRAALETARAERQVSEERLRAAAADLEAKRGDLRVAEERVGRLEERLAALEQQAEGMRLEADRLEQAEPPTAPETDLARARTLAAELAAAASAALAELEQAVAVERGARREVEAGREAHLQRERELATFASRLASLDEQAAALTERLAEVESAATADLAALEAATEQAARERGELDAALDLARLRQSEAQERQAMAAAEAVSRQRAAERLRAAFEARRGYAQGPRNALTSGLPGVHGSVADLLRVQSRYQVAIAGALGRRSEYVVVDSSESAKAVLEHVRQAGGFVTLLPLDLLRPANRAVSAAQLAEAGVIAEAASLVSAEPVYQPVIELLLGGTLVVESLEAATRIARKPGARSRLVTLSGDVVETSGAISGGKRSQQATVLGAAADLEDAERLAAEAAEQIAITAAALEAARQRVGEAQQRVQAAAERLEDASRGLATAREEARGRERLLTDLRSRLAEVNAERAALSHPRPTGGQPNVPDEAELARLGALLEAARLGEAEARAQAAEARHEVAMLEERWAGYHAGRLRYEQSQQRLKQLRAEAAASLERVAQVKQDVERSRWQVERAKEALPEGLDAEREAAEAALKRVIEVESELTELSERQAALAGELEEARVAMARRETSLELADEELKAFPPGATRLELGERAARSRLREVSEQLDALGAVNHRAQGEYQEIRTRKETLEVETVQAALAVTELEGTLERIDRETTALLGAELKRLELSFGRHVQHLFGEAADGSIETVREEGRPVGIRIVLMPPGKQTHSLHLLSVGERTMGALAFLFALMADGPQGGLPVAVLDEVDAPLDEANIRRFCTFVARLAKHGTQFVLITHQKATFEVADTLWGVTTEQGVSRVFSVRREEAVLG